jgi:tight adherence protein B
MTVLYFFYLLAFVGIGIFVVVGISLFSKGWESYEEKYIEGAEKSFESMFLTIPPQHILYLRVLCVFLGYILFFVLTSSFVLGAIVGGLGFFLPQLVIKLYKKRRDRRFADQLVDALSTLSNALRSGFSLPKAFSLIQKDMPKPISQEFGILTQELRLGLTVEEAMMSMLKRMPSEDLDLLVTSITISSSVGGNLTEVFDQIAKTIRERHRIEGRIRALTSQGRLQGLIVGLMPVVLALIFHLIDPTLMKPLYTTFWGYVLIGVMVVFEFLGFFFIRKICTIKV